ncbi:hypothetical protein [Hyphomicrobium sp.]|uniref:hypothetical protein n=1 Tax=Hyphomicrobium sp. TaxID=82 RepID=UPI001DED50AF|nr:hypothetical protein [Hyphomicrobium sp.]MBY0560482.1 hypothetical protein [Hyphomicrobium sp.]
MSLDTSAEALNLKTSDRIGKAMLASMARWALILGIVGFLGGFVGPIVFTPEANQGPLLGIFITGPLGVVLGAVVGLVIAVRDR